MKKRLGSALLAAIWLLSLILPASATENPFSDVAENAYYSSAVLWALENGVTTGTSETTFSPENTCTRAQVVTFLWRSQGKPEPTTAKNIFTDVSASDYFYKPVLWAVENGITNGTSDTTFSPGSTCTRAQVLTFLWRAENEPAASGESVLAGRYVNQYFTTAVAWADTMGMLSHMGTTAFDAYANCPRSDIVTYLYRFATGDIGTDTTTVYTKLTPTSASAFNAASVPAYSGSSFVQMNGNTPYFSLDNLTTQSYEMYGALDRLGRCTACVACIGTDLMPTEKRDSISSVKPTGWHTTKYDTVDGGYLYNRCHLIGYQLSGENANAQNLITGTRYFNLNMLDYENLIAEYVEDANAHILYRVTPVFSGSNLVATGVLMEGMSVEDQGKSVKFCVFMYNVQPGIVIDYTTGDSYAAEEKQAEDAQTTTNQYILNTNSRKFHLPTCAQAAKISSANRSSYTGSRDDLLRMGYTPCKNCKP